MCELTRICTTEESAFRAESSYDDDDYLLLRLHDCTPCGGSIVRSFRRPARTVIRRGEPSKTHGYSERTYLSHLASRRLGIEGLVLHGWVE